MFKSVLIAAALAFQGLTALQGASAQPLMPLRFGMPVPAMAQDAARIPPSQAAVAAQSAYPGSTVLNVKLLPNGEYAVTLKVGGSVQRVMVNATSGQVS